MVPRVPFLYPFAHTFFFLMLSEVNIIFQDNHIIQIELIHKLEETDFIIVSNDKD